MCDDAKTLTCKVEKLWNGDQKDNIKKNLDGWLNACKEGEDNICKAKKQFHQWHPLRVYVSVGKAKSSNKPVFSLRFFGQEVAELIVKDKVMLCLKSKQYFKGLTLKQGKYSWKGKEAKEFRAFFKKLAIDFNGSPEIKSIEHRIESKFIVEMLKGSGKFGCSGLKIQPITLGGCPLQFPVPFSANTGEPKGKSGHIDILARRKGKDNKVRLSVWELKRPGEYRHAASQAYIYAIQLLRILRSGEGKKWYKVFGFNGAVPKSLEIEAVVAITRNQASEKKFTNDQKMLGENNKINGDIIKLYAVYYKEKPDAILLDENSFQEN
jgi:hypothetical protein